jgi:RHS repeat-associated protein
MSEQTQAAAFNMASGLADTAQAAAAPTGTQTAGFSQSTALIAALVALRPATQNTATISLVGTATAADNGSTNTLTVNLPAGTQPGDQVIVASNGYYGDTVTAPTGYTAIGTYTTGTTGTSGQMTVFDHTVAPGDTAVILNYSQYNDESVTLAVYRGVDPNTPLDGTSSAHTTYASSITAPSITTTVAGDRLLNLQGASSNSSGQSWTAPTGMTEQTQASAFNMASGLADKTVSASGATGTQTATFSQSTALIGVLAAIKPAKGAFPTTYSYNSDGDLTTIAPEQTSTTLAYNQTDQLTSYGTAATYLYSGDHLEAATTTTAGTSQLTWNTNNNLPLLLSDSTNDFIYGPGTSPVEQVSLSTSTPTYLMYTPSDSSWLSTNNAGDETGYWVYDAYGTPTLGTPASPFGYSGQYTDQPTGLVNDRARFYQPQEGGFTTRDPLFDQTDTAYTYASGDPVNNADPSGDITTCSFSSDKPTKYTLNAVSWVQAHAVIGCNGYVYAIRFFGCIEHSKTPSNPYSWGVDPDSCTPAWPYGYYYNNGNETTRAVHAYVHTCIPHGATWNYRLHYRITAIDAVDFKTYDSRDVWTAHNAYSC